MKKPAVSKDALGRIVAEAVFAGDLRRLEFAACVAGTYQALKAAADAAGVDPGALEELLASI